MKRILFFMCFFSVSFLAAQEGVNIMIKTTPSGAAIYLDNANVGNTGSNGVKVIQAVSYGKHSIRIEKSGYQSTSKTVEVDELTNSFEFILKKITEKKNQLFITCNVPGASVYLDEKQVGKTDSEGKIMIPSVLKGNYSLRVEKDGYTTFTQSIAVDENKRDFDFKLALKSAPPPAAAQGKKFLLRCNTAGARILINGAEQKQKTIEGSTILVLPPGIYEVKVEKVGFQPVRKVVSIGSELDVIEEFTLSKSEADATHRGNTSGGIKLEIVFIFLVFAVMAVVVFVLYWIIKSSKRLGVIGKFELLKIIGKGGMATIYKAKDLMRKKIVALKVMDHALIRDAELVYKFFSEGEAISRINKEFPDAPVVKVFDYGRDKEKSLGVPYISMELVKGESLLKLIKKNGTADDKRKLFIAREVTKALSAAHKLGIFHGDITPDNILVDGDKVTLIDFGVASQEHDTYKNMDATITGKPVYMSPEQCAGLPIDEKSDMYSLGIILFFMFYGTPPFLAKNPLDIMKMHQTDVLPEMKTLIPGEVKKLVSRLLEKEPQKRPGTGELHTILDRLIGREK